MAAWLRRSLDKYGAVEVEGGVSECLGLLSGQKGEDTRRILELGKLFSSECRLILFCAWFLIELRSGRGLRCAAKLPNLVFIVALVLGSGQVDVAKDLWEQILGDIM